MATTITFTPGGYRFIPGVFQYSAGVAAQPGFAIDEPLLELGRALKLPPWLEPDREQIERMLPKLDLPDSPALR